MKKLLLILLIWVTTIFLWSYLDSIYLADKLSEKSQRYLSKGDTTMANSLIYKAIEKNPNEPNYHRIKAKILLVKSVSETQESKELLKENILRELKTAEEENPNNLVTIRNIIPLYYFLALKDASVLNVPFDIDETYLPITRDYYQWVKSKYSHDAGVVVALAKYEKKLGLSEDYEKSVEIIKKIRPDLLDWYESFR